MAATDRATFAMISSPSPARRSLGSARKITAASAPGRRSLRDAIRAAMTDLGVSKIAGNLCAAAMASPGVHNSSDASAFTRAATSSGAAAAASVASAASPGVMSPYPPAIATEFPPPPQPERSSSLRSPDSSAEASTSEGFDPGPLDHAPSAADVVVAAAAAARRSDKTSAMVSDATATIWPSDMTNLASPHSVVRPTRPGAFRRPPSARSSSARLTTSVQ